MVTRLRRTADFSWPCQWNSPRNPGALLHPTFRDTVTGRHRKSRKAFFQPFIWEADRCQVCLHLHSDHPMHTKSKKWHLSAWVKWSGAYATEMAIILVTGTSWKLDLLKEINQPLWSRGSRRGRQRLLLSKKSEKADRRKVLTALTFFLDMKAIRYLLHRSERMRNVFLSDHLVAYRWGGNFKDLLVHHKTKLIVYILGKK